MDITMWIRFLPCAVFFQQILPIILFLLVSVSACGERKNTDSKNAKENQRITSTFSNKFSDEEFVDFCKTATAEQITQAIQAGANPNARTKDNRTALMAASRNNNSDSVLALIESGADVNAFSHKGITAIMFATKKETPDNIRILLKHGADVNAVTYNGVNTLMLALRNTSNNFHMEIIPVLVDAGININSKDISSNTPLLMAAEANTPEVVSMLIHAGANIHVKNSEGISPIIAASACNSPKVISIIIDAGGNIEDRDNKGVTPLSFAAYQNTLEAVYTLINAGADVYAINNEGKNALDYAEERGDEEISELIRRAMAGEGDNR